MKAVVAALLLILASVDGLAHGGPDVKAPDPGASPALEAAARAVDAFHEALMKGNREGALALLDDQVQIYEQGWVERSKAEYAAHHLASDIEFSAATSRRLEAQSGVISGDLAYVASEATVTGTFKSKAVASITLETMVLHRTQGGWLIAHIHWSSRSAKK